MKQSFVNLFLSSRLAALTHPFQDVLAVLVQLQLVDDNFRGVDADRHALAVRLLAGNPLDVDDVLETVDAGNLAFSSLVRTPNDSNLIVLADGYRANLYCSSIDILAHALT